MSQRFQAALRGYAAQLQRVLETGQAISQAESHLHHLVRIARTLSPESHLWAPPSPLLPDTKMKLESTRQLPVSRELAWQALNDVDVLKRCIPGCESLTQAADGTLEAVVVTRIGPVGARFGGKVTLEDVNPPSSYRLVFAGQGGAAGFAKGEARVELHELSKDSTELRYTSEAAVGGKLAQVGSRLIESSAKKLAEEFFTRFEAAVSPPPAATPAQTIDVVSPEMGAFKVPASAPPGPAAGPREPAPSNKVNWWLAGALAVSLIALAVCALS